jgi:4-hydroxy-tetrahydrodipicolinate reductase
MAELSEEPSGGGAGARLGIAVVGAAGRMGRRLVGAIEAAPDLVLAGRVDPAGVAEGARRDLADLDPTGIDVVVEFSRGSAIATLGPAIARLGRPWVSGTTAIDAAGRSAMEQASRAIPVLWAPNLSLGITLLGRLLDLAARLLPESWQMELVETHHGAKIDAPSGTALALAERWIGRRGGQAVHGRSGATGPRPPDQVGIHSVRLPDVVGQHQVLLGGAGEAIELSHRALDRDAFVTGALEAARWMVGRPAGLYSLDDWAEERLA